MTPRFLLDTNICIYIRQKRRPEVLARFSRLKPGEAVLSVITYGELVFGAEKSSQRNQAFSALEELITLLPVMPLTIEAALVYGDMRRDLERRGEMIGNNDLWIAAHARAAALTVVTNNEREFQRVRGLKIQNWAV